MKLYQISLSLTPNGLIYKTREQEVEEKKVCYSARGLRIMKEDLLQPKTPFYEHLGVPMNYNTYCLHEHIEVAKNILFGKINSQIEKFTSQLDETLVNFKKGVTKDEISTNTYL